MIRISYIGYNDNLFFILLNMYHKFNYVNNELFSLLLSFICIGYNVFFFCLYTFFFE